MGDRGGLPGVWASGWRKSWLRMFLRPPEEVWNEHGESTRGRDLDITGLSYTPETAGLQAVALPGGCR